VNRNRHCEIGDLLIREDKLALKGQKHIGLVTGVKELPRISGTSVFVEWTGTAPYDYNSTYGYSLVNVHNQYNLFTIEKARAS